MKLLLYKILQAVVLDNYTEEKYMQSNLYIDSKKLIFLVEEESAKIALK